MDEEPRAGTSDGSGVPIAPAEGAAPPDDVSGDIGAVALSEEEQAALMAHDDDPKHPRGNEELAYEMSSKLKGFANLASELEKSDDPADVEFARTLRERGEELALAARERYVKQEAALKSAREALVGFIVGATQGHYQAGIDMLVMGYAKYGDFGSFVTHVLHGSEDGERDLTPSHAEQLRREVYAMLGVKAPSQEEFIEANKDLDLDSPDPPAHQAGEFRTESEQAGLALVERQSYRRDGIGKPERALLKLRLEHIKPA
jgi:hypothetical protein